MTVPDSVLEYHPPVFDIPEEVRMFLKRSVLTPLVSNLNVDSQSKYPQLQRISIALEDALQTYDHLSRKMSEYTQFQYGCSAATNFEFVACACGGMLQNRMPFPDKNTDLGQQIAISDVQYLEAHAWYYAYLSARAVNLPNLSMLYLEHACTPMTRQYGDKPQILYFIVNYLNHAIHDPLQDLRVLKLCDMADEAVERIEKSSAMRGDAKYLRHRDFIKGMVARCRAHIPTMREALRKERQLANRVQRAKREAEGPHEPYNPFKKRKCHSFSHLFTHKE